MIELGTNGAALTAALSMVANTASAVANKATSLTNSALRSVATGASASPDVAAPTNVSRVLFATDPATETVAPREEGLELLRRLEGEVCLVCIVGRSMTGKSWLLNKLVAVASHDSSAAASAQTADAPQRDAGLKGIQLASVLSTLGAAEKQEAQKRATFEINTTGAIKTDRRALIYLGPSVPVQESSGSSPATKTWVFVDTEGLMEEDASGQVAVGAMTALMTVCSYVVYNHVGAITPMVVSECLVTLPSAATHAASSTQSSRSLNFYRDLGASPLAPKLLWVLRDADLDLRNPDGTPASGKSYLESQLRSTSSGPLIRGFFAERDCFILPSPGEIKGDSASRKEFDDSLKGLWNALKGEMRVKTFVVDGGSRADRATGRGLSAFIPRLVSSIVRPSSSTTPPRPVSILDTWKMVSLDACSAAEKESATIYEDAMRGDMLSAPLPVENFKSAHARNLGIASRRYESLAFGPSFIPCLKSLLSTIGNLSSDAKVPATGLVAKFLSRNLEASREELGESVLGALRDRILAGEFATPADVEQAYDNAARDHKDLVKSLAVEDVWRFPGSQLRSTLAAMVTLQQGGGGAAKPAREVVKEVVKEVQDPAMIKKLEESVNMYNELRLASEHHMDKCKSQKVDARAKLETANARIAQLERELKAARLVASADPSSEASRAASLGIDFGKTAASEPSSQAAQAAAPPVSSPPASVSSMASQETPMTVAIPDDRVPKLLSLLAHTKNRGDVLEAKLRELASILQHRTAELAARTSESRAREGMLAERVRYLEHQITLVSGAGEAINMAMARERQLCGRIAELERMLAIGHSGGMEAPAGTAAPAGYEQSLIMSALDPDHADAARELLFDDEGPMERSENAGTPLKKKDAILD